MKAHELGKLLLEGPDLVVCKLTITCHRDGEEETFDEVSEAELRKDTFFRDPAIVSGDEILQRDSDFIFIF